MEVQVSLKVALNEDTKYNMDLGIPTDINKENPFHFEVVQETEQGEKKESIMKIAFCDKEHLFAQIQPPESLLELGGMHEYIEEFRATVKEGMDDNGNYIESSTTPEEDSSQK